MEEKTKHVTCPVCDGEIKWIKQFPLAQITSFDYLPLPNLIRGPVEDTLPTQKTITNQFFRKKVIQNPQISEEVTQRLAQSDEFSYQGRVYRKVNLTKHGTYAKEDFFECNPDASREDFERSAGPWEFEQGVRIYTDLTVDVRKFLSQQEKTLKTLEECAGKIMPTKDIFNLLQVNNKYPTDLREFSFSVHEHNLGECVLNIESARDEADIHLGAGPGAYMIGFQLETAKFAYNGLFRVK